MDNGNDFWISRSHCSWIELRIICCNSTKKSDDICICIPHKILSLYEPVLSKQLLMISQDSILFVSRRTKVHFYTMMFRYSANCKVRWNLLGSTKWVGTNLYVHIHCCVLSQSWNTGPCYVSCDRFYCFLIKMWGYGERTPGLNRLSQNWTLFPRLFNFMWIMKPNSTPIYILAVLSDTLN